MKNRLLLGIPVVFLFAAVIFFSQNATSEEPAISTPDKALCAKMLRFGKQAYQRGKYLDAKEYFRKAVQADSHSATAWRYYDMSTIFALAEKVEKNRGLVVPDVSVRGETGAPQAAPPPAPATPKAAPAKPKIPEEEEDEGC